MQKEINIFIKIQVLVFMRCRKKIVICLSLGKSTILRYHWRLPGSSDHKFEPTDIKLNHGDVYIMSEKATGWDWKLRSKVRVVHGAGSKYIN